ncbi:MAG: hypothetical protein IPH07_29255 [Deltaproteobacteria bacterium]|nr:hypothetical protein [Deltaproteobacteria bacterium]MBK8714998.1 hypothetical protein [Deltaproteobacteria bacterium]MBP7290452.1 hypothetical protein [Nannocystaceae bacterium]
MRLLRAVGFGAIGTLVVGSVAHAHSNGQPGPGCVGCHGGGDITLALESSQSEIDPGEQVVITISVSSAGGAVAGLFVEADAGSMTTISGEGLATVPAGLTHSQPKSMSGGSTSFDFRWTAPNSPGAVRFAISVLVGNGNGSSSGDKGDSAHFDLVYGCEGQQYFLDFDDDAYGRDDASRLECAGAAPSDHAMAGGDCDDTRESVHPGAEELCNKRDDDCDGEIDEDAIPITLYPDADGDGYYGAVEGASTDTVVGCVGTPGYAGEAGDCEPNDAEKHPGAEEVCNLYDDNCDGRVDERVRPICGVGWCAREAWTCDPANCDPGKPSEETCNLLDDDCDDQLDEDVVCDDGASCVAGECREGQPGDEGSGTNAGTAGGGSDTGGSEGGTGGAPGATGGGTRSRCAMTPAADDAPWLLLVLALVRRRR